MMYSKQYMKHFTQPRNSGEVVNPDAVCEVAHTGGGCFDRIKMSMKVDGEKITELKYMLRACSGTIAATSALTSIAVGKDLSEAELIDIEVVLKELDGVPEKKMHSVELAVEALKETLAEYKRRS